MAIDDRAAHAAAVTARARLRKAGDAVRRAGQLLAEALDDTDVEGHIRVTRPQDADTVRDLVLLALTEHPQVDVVVLVTPTPRPRQGGEGGNT